MGGGLRIGAVPLLFGFGAGVLAQISCSKYSFRSPDRATESALQSTSMPTPRLPGHVGMLGDLTFLFCCLKRRSLLFLTRFGHVVSLTTGTACGNPNYMMRLRGWLDIKRRILRTGDAIQAIYKT